jgi:hypothetical protein
MTEICGLCGKEEAIIISGENKFCAECYEKRKEEAKFERDKHVIEVVGLKNVKGEDFDNSKLLNIKKENVAKFEKEKEITSPKKEFELIWEKDLENYNLEEMNWVIDKLIPLHSIGVWTGKRGTLKTFLVLNAISCVADGKEFLGKYTTAKGKIIYLDKENGVFIMKQRMPLIKRGLNIETPLGIGFICFSTLKIDKKLDINKIEEIIKEHNPILFVVDTYRRGISFEENDAGEVSRLFVDTLRPLVEKYPISIILIHHDRKGESGGDEMDMIRGSSDLANYVDFILKNERKGDKLILKQLKMRANPEEKPLEIEVESLDESFIKFNLLGEYELKTKDSLCSKVIIEWIMSHKISSFETKEAKEIAFNKGIKKQNFFNGLQILVNEGMLLKKEHGRYEVISKDLKLILT